jgi:hypothetical protein
MFGHWQEPIFQRLIQRLPFIARQPLSTFSMACLVGDGLYILNGKVGSVFDLGLGVIHPGWLLTMGGIAALIGHVFLLAAADQVDQATDETGLIPDVLAACRRVARAITLGWQPANPFMLGFGALTLNGIAFVLDALWEWLFFGLNPVVLLELANGLVMVGGLGAAMLSRLAKTQKLRDGLNAAAPKILAYATILGFALGILGLAPVLLVTGLIFTIGNAAQYSYAARLKSLEHAAVTPSLQ